MEHILRQPDTIYFIYTALAVGVFTLLTGLYQLLRLSENRGEARSRRMKMLEQGASTEQILAVLKPNHSKTWVDRLPLFGDLPRVMRQAGMAARPVRVMLVCGALSLVLALGFSMVLKPMMALPLGLALGFLVPILVIRSRRTQRVDAITKLLPEALDLMARGLRVGHPLNISIAAVGNELPDPVGTEFGLIADQVSFGDNLVDAFAEFAERVDIEDVHYLAASIGIQHGTGGDLARILAVLSGVIRGRIAMRRRIQAISAEGRLTGYFLSVLPLLIFGSTSVMTPKYYSGVYDDPLFIPMACVVVFLVVLNAMILTKLVRFRI